MTRSLAICTAVAILAGPAAAEFTAYNDTVGPASGSAPNVTHYSGYLGGGGGFEDPDGYLKDITTGLDTSVHVLMTAVNVAGSLGSIPDPGTDAHTAFDGIVAVGESASYNSSGVDWSYTAEFTGLDPGKTYEFTTFANRNSSSYDGTGSSSRWTKFSIVGADTFTNTSSAGVVEISPDVVRTNTGYNTVNGYVVRWSGISAADGSFTVISQNVGAGGPGEPIKSYGMQAFILAEAAGPPPSGDLSLEVPAGCLSDEQISVEVWMRNLTGPATGYQAFLAFDDSVLSYNGAASTYESSPFPNHFQNIATADVGAGEIRIDGSDAPGGSGSDQDALLATLVFDVLQECETTSVTFDLTQAFDSELSFEGDAIDTTLVNTGAFTLDDTAPVLDPCPGTVTSASDASVGDGCQGAYVTFTAPTATDNCDPSPVVECDPASGSFFDVGTTQVTCTATDACGNSSTCMFDVVVTPTNLIDVSVELPGSEPATRCIHFVTNDCGNTADAEIDFIDHDAEPGTPVFGTATIEVGCGNWTFLCAKDEAHTLWDTTSLSVSGTKYVLDFTLSLEPGDDDDDGDVDINDVTLVLFQWGAPEPSGGCPWDGTRGGDFTNNDDVFTEDYSLMSGNWLALSDCGCTTALQGPVLDPRLGGVGGWGRSWTLAAMLQPEIAARADLNGDAVVDFQDVAIFERRHGLPDTLSSKMRRTSGIDVHK